MHTVLDGSLLRVFEILNMATESAFSVGFMRSTELWILNGTLSSRALLAVVLDAAFGWHCRMPAAEQILLRPPWLFSMSSSGAFLFLVIWYVWLFCAEKIIDSWTNWPASVWRRCLADSARSRSWLFEICSPISPRFPLRAVLGLYSSCSFLLFVFTTY